MKIMLLLFSLLAYSSDFREYSCRLAKLESGNRHNVENRYGYLGKYQFGHLALVDIGFRSKRWEWTGKYGINNKKDFLESPIVQDIALSEWYDTLKTRIRRTKLINRVNSRFKGVKVTEHGLLAGCHLIGCYSLRLGMQSGVDIEDGNGTKVSKYMKEFVDIRRSRCQSEKKDSKE